VPVTRASRFTYVHYGHLFPDTDRDAAAKLDTIRAGGLDGRGVCQSLGRRASNRDHLNPSPLDDSPGAIGTYGCER